MKTKTYSVVFIPNKHEHDNLVKCVLPQLGIHNHYVIQLDEEELQHLFEEHDPLRSKTEVKLKSVSQAGCATALMVIASAITLLTLLGMK